MTAVATVRIKGMSCGSCTYKIECEVGDLPGVTEAKVDLKSETGTFTYESGSSVNPQQIVDLINKLGFKAELVTFIF